MQSPDYHAQMKRESNWFTGPCKFQARLIQASNDHTRICLFSNSAHPQNGFSFRFHMVAKWQLQMQVCLSFFPLPLFLPPSPLSPL